MNLPVCIHLEAWKFYKLDALIRFIEKTNVPLPVFFFSSLNFLSSQLSSFISPLCNLMIILAKRNFLILCHPLAFFQVDQLSFYYKRYVKQFKRFYFTNDSFCLRMDFYYIILWVYFRAIKAPIRRIFCEKLHWRMNVTNIHKQSRKWHSIYDILKFGAKNKSQMLYKNTYTTNNTTNATVYYSFVDWAHHFSRFFLTHYPSVLNRV